VEWGEKFENVVEQSDAEVKIDQLGDSNRKISLTVHNSG
jgi:tRNA A37 threonylcarbamoyladenosine biosynthesis protein TsaE